MIGTLFVLPFPAIDPVLIAFGPLAIRWYSLAYIAGLLIGWGYVVRLAGARGRDGAGADPTMTRLQVDDFLVWATLAVIVGGRLGYVLFYDPAAYLENPSRILALWKGGMSFHGGLLGMLAAMALYARRIGLPFLAVSDLVACAAPIGLFFGRIANFTNGELFGRPSDLPWAMVFPAGGPLPRHPSQLYESFLEGAVLFAVLWYLFHRTGLRRRTGALSGIFLIGYAAARMAVEFVRQPDAHIGFLVGGATMGQLLSLPMAALGLFLVWRARAPGRDN